MQLTVEIHILERTGIVSRVITEASLGMGLWRRGSLHGGCMAALGPSAALSFLHGSCIATSTRTKRVIFAIPAVVWPRLLSQVGCVDASLSSCKGCVAASVLSPM